MNRFRPLLRNYLAALAVAVLAAFSAFASIIAQSAGPRSLWAIVLIIATALFALLTFRVNAAGTDEKPVTEKPSAPPTERLGPIKPSQLTRDLFDFVGRDQPLVELHEELTTATSLLPTVVVTGMGGIGKTVFATRLCHGLAGNFPDGQLYINMQGYGGSDGPSPVDPADALTEFLLALGVAGQAVPQTVQDKARMYRSCLAGRRVLVMIDNAADEAQVRHLIPGCPTCLVVVTSRSTLAGLDGARSVELGVFAEGEALMLLAKLVGAARVVAEPDAARTIVRLCGLLPLAVRIAGVRLAARPQWQFERLVELLGDEASRLNELRAGDVAVQASLALTYQALTPSDQRAFRLLSELNVADAAEWLIAAVIGALPVEAAAAIERLVAARLVEEVTEVTVGASRYRMHDLVRAYGRERLRLEEAPRDADAALRRTLGAALELADAADSRLQPGDMHGSGERRAERWPVADSYRARVIGEPMAWFASERMALVQLIDQASAAGLLPQVWELASSLADFLDMTARWDDWARTHQLALTAALTVADQRGEAITLYHFGRLYRYRQEFGEAIRCLQQALEIYRDLDDQLRESCTLRNLGIVHEQAGRLSEALEYYEECLPTFASLDNDIGQALALRGIGVVYAADGRLDEAAAVIERSVLMFRSNGHAFGEANALEDLGGVQLRAGRLGAAAESLRRSLAMFESFGHVVGEAKVLSTMGELYVQQQRLDLAVGCLQQALDRYRRLRLGQAAQVLDQRLGAIGR